MGIKIKMLKTVPASQDGRIVEKFQKGKIYEAGVTITERLAEIFLTNHEEWKDVAELVEKKESTITKEEEKETVIDDVILEPVPVKKKMEIEPENKMEKSADENKDEKKKKKLEDLKKREKMGFGRAGRKRRGK